MLPVSRSIDAISLPLCLLQIVQHKARFSGTVSPPCFRAITWSISWETNVRFSGVKQYSHLRFARARTCARNSALRSDIGSGSDSEDYTRFRLGNPHQVF